MDNRPAVAGAQTLRLLNVGAGYRGEAEHLTDIVPNGTANLPF